MQRIEIVVGGLAIEAELNESVSAQKIWDALPITVTACTWGDEVFFEIPVNLELEANAVQDVEVGTLGYWPPGRALCIFFGKTPISRGDKPRAYSPVNVVGAVPGDLRMLKRVRSGDEVKVQKKS